MATAVRRELFDNRPYMWGWEVVAEDGTLTTFVRTGDAVVALPYMRRKGVYYVYLLKQERPEIGETVLKTVGGYIREGEEAGACAVRNLRDKLGIVAEELTLVGSTLGYTVAKIPIKIFFVSRWRYEGEPAPCCKLVRLTVEEAIELAVNNAVGDDSTKEPLFRLYIDLLTNKRR